MMLQYGRWMPAALMAVVALAACNPAHSGDAYDRSVSASTGAADGKRPINVDDLITRLDLGGMSDSGLSVSPDGKHVAFQAHRVDLRKDDYRAAWYVLDLEAGVPKLVGDAGDALLFRARDGSRVNGAWFATDPIWSPDGDWIAYRRMDDGSVQVWRSSIDGTVREQLTHSEADVDAFWWSADGQRIWFETGATERERTEYVNARWKGGMPAGERNFRPSTAEYAVQPYELTGGRPRLWVMDVASGQTRQATEEERRERYASRRVAVDEVFGYAKRSSVIPGRPLSRNVTWYPDGGKVAWLESKVEAVAPQLRIHVDLDPEDDRSIECELAECFGWIGDLWWSRDGREIVFRRRGSASGGRSTIYGWRIDTNALRTIHVESGGHLSACSSTGHSLICFVDRPSYPRVIAEIELADGTLTELYDPNPQFEEVLTGDAEWIEWSNEFGVRTFAWLVKPIAYSPDLRYPLVIVQYNARSCFEGGTGAENPVHLFAAAGFAVLCFDQPVLQEVAATVPLIEYERAAWEDFREKRVILSSLESAIDILDRKGIIDPSRVGITGLSSGTHTISYALSHSDRFAAAIVANLAWAPTGYFSAARWVRAFQRERGFGRPGTEDDKYLAGMSLGLNVARVNTPILIQVSDDEVHTSMFNYVTLHESGKAVDMYVYRDEYHVKWHPSNRRAVAIRAVDWMRFWLLGEEDDDPKKAGQYERWRELRRRRQS